VLFLVVLSVVSGCTWLAEKMPVSIAKPVIETSQDVMNVAADVTEKARSTAQQSATTATTAQGAIGWRLIDIALAGLAVWWRRGLKSAQAALTIITDKIDKHDAGAVKGAVKAAMMGETNAVRAVLAETLRP